MPIYDHHCNTCGGFEHRRPMAESRSLALCPTCGVPALRVLSAPQLNLMSGNNRIAESRNEKSAHAPDVVHKIGSQAAYRHDKQPHDRARQHRPHAPSRPWMLGH